MNSPIVLLVRMIENISNLIPYTRTKHASNYHF